MPGLIISKYEATSNDTTKNINSDKTFQFKKIAMIYRKLISFPQNNLSDTRFFACVKLKYFTKLCCFVALTWCRRHIWHTTRENKRTKEQGKQWKQ